jgi:uncharacterized damage-inducible protein DinB
MSATARSNGYAQGDIRRCLGIGYALGMTLAALRNMLNYHYWARDRLLDALEPLGPDQFRQDLGSSFGSIRNTLVHVVSAEWVWCSRWLGKSPSGHLAATDLNTVQDVRARWVEEEARIRRFVDQLGPEGVVRVIQYTHFDGEPRNSVFWHMLQHVVNHASFHRGQVTTMLRQLGARPPQSQDMIAYYRH